MFSIFDYFKNWQAKKEISLREKNIYSLLSGNKDPLDTNSLDVAYIQLIQDLEKMLLQDQKSLSSEEKIRLLEIIFKLEKTKKLALINSCHHLSSDEIKKDKLRELFEKVLAGHTQELVDQESLLIPLMVSSQAKHKIVLVEIQKNNLHGFSLKFFKTTEKSLNFSHHQTSIPKAGLLKSYFLNPKIYLSKKIKPLEKKEKFPDSVNLETSCKKILKVWLEQELKDMPTLKEKVLNKSLTSNKIIPFQK